MNLAAKGPSTIPIRNAGTVMLTVLVFTVNLIINHLHASPRYQTFFIFADKKPYRIIKAPATTVREVKYVYCIGFAYQKQI